MKWKLIEDKYEISDTGLVMSNQELILKTRKDKDGYLLVTLWINGKAFTKKIHRLVATAFIDNPENLPTVNHKDGNKTNNNVDNLEWLSIGDNHRHAFVTGLHTVGENRKAGKKVKLTNNDVLVVKEMIKDGFGNTEIGRVFGVSCGCIYAIRVGKSWSHLQLPPSE